MSNRIFFAIDTTKRKISIAILCGTLIVAIGTGAAFAVNNADAKPTTSVTAMTDTSPSVIAEQYAMRFEQYSAYGMTYDKESDNLYFDSKLVRYFEDYYPVGDNGYVGIDYFNENGTIDIHGIRDLTQIVRNADGSYDPSGKLMGVEPYSQAEFDARDIEKLKNPPQAYTVCVADNASYSTTQTSQYGSGGQMNNATTYVIANENATVHNTGGSYDPSGTMVGVEQYSQAEFEARDTDKLKNQPQAYTVCMTDDASYSTAQTSQYGSGDQMNNATTYAIVNEDVSDIQGETFAERFLKYKEYGITFSEQSINGGIGNVYYQDQLVRNFVDLAPDGGIFTLSSADGGSIKVCTVYDENGKLTGVEIVEN